MNELDMILSLWEKLGERERKVLLTFANRMLAGQRRYGHLYVGKKHWGYEAIEEALDAAVYLSALLQDKVDFALNSAVLDAEKAIKDEVMRNAKDEEYIPDTERQS